MSKEPKTTEDHLIAYTVELLTKHDFTKENILEVAYKMSKVYAKLIDEDVFKTVGKEIGQG